MSESLAGWSLGLGMATTFWLPVILNVPPAMVTWPFSAPGLPLQASTMPLAESAGSNVPPLMVRLLQLKSALDAPLVKVPPLMVMSP